MKMLFRLIAMVFLLCTITITFAQDKAISFSNLPDKAKTFLKKYFSDAEIITVKMGTEYIFKKEYEVVLKTGSKIEFDSDGIWEKIEMKGVAVPVQIIPSTISQYIRKSFPNTFVKEIIRARKGYEVEISNGLDLEFSGEGEFIRVDD